MELNKERLLELAHLLPGNGMHEEDLQQATKTMLQAFGEDPEREGLLRTPGRVARMYGELLAGYRVDPIAMVNEAVFEEEYDAMVVVRDIEYYSLCEHHMLPFIGRASVAYLADNRVIGLSKIPRIVDMFARRLQVQERMTHQIAEFLMELLQPRGVAVVVEGLHLCATMRGVKKHDARMTTSAMLGTFRTNLATREEFLANISRGTNPILGACNPPLAFKALSTDPLMGLMLPCNVTVEADPEGGSLARLVNPETMLATGSLRQNENLRAVAEEARARLERVACALADEAECG